MCKIRELALKLLKISLLLSIVGLDWLTGVDNKNLGKG